MLANITKYCQFNEICHSSIMLLCPLAHGVVGGAEQKLGMICGEGCDLVGSPIHLKEVLKPSLSLMAIVDIG